MTVLLDSITDLTERHRGAHVLVGSHGGLATAAAAVGGGVRSLVVNDAGIGLDQAGIAALGYCLDFGIPAASIAHSSARIGDADDMLARGVVSAANTVAHELGVEPGCSASETAARLESSTPERPISPPTSIPFHRSDTCVAGVDILLCDSASQVIPADAGRIVLTGSHGGMPGGDPKRAAKADVALVIFNDAGVGIDNAGITRLRALDARSIPAACVDCNTARIGEARSTLETGMLSHVNAAALRRGLHIGMSARAAAIQLNNAKD